MAKTDRWGIDAGYQDCEKHWKRTPAEARRAILACMGVEEDESPPPPPVMVVPAGKRKRLGRGRLHLEDGRVLEISQMLPPRAPPGYHDFFPAGGAEPLRVIVTPERCPLADDMKVWGWAAQLYTVRSGASWGIGDLADLRRLAEWSASLGARVLMVNPLFAAAPVEPQQPSPYYPTTRCYRNPLYLRIEEVPGARDAGIDLELLAGEGRSLNCTRRIDRDRVFRLKMEALERLHAIFTGDAAFEEYRRREGEALERFATFCAIAERHGGGRQDWPADYRDPASTAVAHFAASHSARIRFHAWLQWLIDRQLERASRPLALIGDLPVGVDPGGADAWVWQQQLALDMSVGAPPDPYSATGQDWGLPPFVPHRLRQARYEPFIQTMRAAFRHAGGLRIDHVMGLFRLFWIPKGMSAGDGAYVRYPAGDLLGIVALEAQRAGAFVIGEDLGTVEDGVRETLERYSVLSSRVLWFEADPPASYPRRTMASITTHDLPTVAGVWTGSDSPPEMLEKLHSFTGLAGGSDAREAVVRAHELLASAPSAVVLASVEDALAVSERPNRPGTLEPENWSLALPKPLEEIESDSLAAAVAGAFREQA
jgi:4-alpha-glucanotransferase